MMKTYTKIILTVCAVFALCLAAYAVTWNGATTIFSSQTRSDETYTSTKADQNSLLISTSGKVTINNATVTKTGDSLHSDNCRYYGVNAGVMCKSGDEKGETYFNGGNIQADAEGGDGLVCYYASAYLKDSVISSPKSRGVVAAEKGFVTLNNTRVYCDSLLPYGGAVCAEYWGNASISGGKAWGSACPAIYSEWYVFAENADLYSMDDPAVVVAETGNADIHDCTVRTGQESENPPFAVLFTNENSTGVSSFTMTGGEIDSIDKFSVQNSSPYIFLKEVTMSGYPGTFLEVYAGEDENGGAIGGNVTLDMLAQSAEGDVNVNSLASLKLNMDQGSSFRGCINNAGPEGDVAVTVTGGSVWTLTGDSYISTIDAESPDSVVLNGHTLYVNGTPYDPNDTAVTGVSLNQNTATVFVGDFIVLEAEVTPASAADKKVTWQSYDKTIATVDSYGIVTGVAPGTTTIRAKTREGGFTAKCKVTVKEPVVSVESVTLNKTKVTLDKGASVTLKATVAPAEATNKAVTWTSYDTAIATVDQNGKVKAVA
ncbi:MAG: Ig domain-containing protein, partial [Abditibacteriota bacterium]|nr:Ig domain-containing protein [Abditibacteriota bacterium]